MRDPVKTPDVTREDTRSAEVLRLVACTEAFKKGTWIAFAVTTAADNLVVETLVAVVVEITETTGE